MLSVCIIIEDDGLGLHKMFFKNLNDGYISWFYVARFWLQESCNSSFYEKTELSLCQAVPDGSKTDLLLAKAEPIGKAGEASSNNIFKKR